MTDKLIRTLGLLTYLLTYLCQIVLYEHGSLFNMEEMEKAGEMTWH